MVSIERIKKGKSIYFYVSKNFRISKNKWKKISKYFGKKAPKKKDIKKAAEQIEKEALVLGIKKPKSKFKYLKEEDAEVLEDLKNAYLKWFKKLPRETKEKYESDFLVRFTYNSNAIEGNTLTLRETNMILQENIIPTDATTYEYNEVLNSREAMNFIKEYKGKLNEKFILRIHRILTKKTAVKIVGRYRNHDVIIQGSNYVPPSYKEVKKLMRKFFVWYNNNRKRLHPLELSCLVHTKFVRVHPFSDGNGRTSRVLTNFTLSKKGYPMFFIENKNRREYYEALEQSDRGNERAFIKFIFKNIINQLKSKTVSK